ncbi:MAG: Ig-like domain-containing protein [Longimicrobiales bacterium]
MPNRGPSTRSICRGALLLSLGFGALVSCTESVVQIEPDDAVELRASVDSAGVMIGRTFDVDAFPVDAAGTLLVGQNVTWSSSNGAVATVDADGLVTGVAAGTTNVVVQLLALRDTTFVTVAPPPALVLAADSVGFVASAGGADPAPDSVAVTNGGAFDLVVSVDSTVYLTGAGGWLTAQLDGSIAPLNLILTPSSSGVTTASTSRALVWLSGVDADGSPASVEVTLRVTAGNAAAMSVNDGNNQTRTVAGPVTIAPSVLVRDAFTNPAVGQTVTFAVTGGGGQVTGASAIVDANGIARVGSWTLGQTAGANQLTASIGILAPVSFSATGTPGPATQVVVTAGNSQSAVAGAPVGVPPSVAVRDQFGNGVAGVAVTFAVTSGGGSITGGSQTSAGASGTATVGSWTLGGAAGANTLSVTATGVGAPAVVTATGLSGAADSIYATAGDAQTDTVAATLSVAYSVRVVDTNGNGVAGIPVAWTATFGGGSITPLDTTDATGFATAVRVLGTVPGVDSATASVGGLPGSPVKFGATANVGSAATITIQAGHAQTDTVNQIVPIAPQVRIADKFDNPIQGRNVTFVVTSGGGTVAPTNAIATLANGTATVTSWQLGTTAGANRDTLTATATGTGITGNPVRFVASSVAGSPTVFTILAGDAQTAVTGTAVATAPVVRLADAFGNGVSGRTVNFTTSGGSVGTPSPATGGTGQASTSWTVNVSGGTVQANGTFPDTLFANTTGFTQLRITASARYSFPTHVQTILATNCTSGCHGGGGGSAGIVFDISAAQSHAYVVNVIPGCDATLPTQYRRVSNAGGIAAAETYSILIRKIDPNFGNIGTCIGHSGGEFANGSPQLAVLHAWIRNGAPDN